MSSYLPASEKPGVGQGLAGASTSQSAVMHSTLGSVTAGYSQSLSDPEYVRERALRHSAYCTAARDESQRIAEYRLLQRDVVCDDMLRTRRKEETEALKAKLVREERWRQKTAKSPFTRNLPLEDADMAKQVAVRNYLVGRRESLNDRRKREARNAIFRRVVAESDELSALRADKRLLKDNEKQLRAMRDVERTNARMIAIQAERQKEIEERQARLQQKLLQGKSVLDDKTAKPSYATAR